MTITVVTGAAGHVGANLVRVLLARGDKVRALIHHDQRALQGLDVEIVQGDVRDQETLCRAFAGAQTVYHTAAHVSISMDAWPRLEAVNVTGTQNVVEACLRCGVSRLVHFSSIEALNDRPLSAPVDESRPLVDDRCDPRDDRCDPRDDRCDPRDDRRCPPYARSKAAAEQQVRQGLARGLDAVILYPTAILGPYDYRCGFATAGLRALARGELPALVEGGFNWVDVRDVVQGALQAAARAPSGARYILGGHWASLRDLAKLVEQHNGTRAPRLVVPMWLARAGASFVTAVSRLAGKQPFYTPAALKPLRSNRCISHARATRDLDYHPRPLQDTVVDTLDWIEEYERTRTL
ncbi:MAG: NAD-dependent epimerase/dehydratase family protein [Anaerolineae bacterium]|nr:NAD-dependent epimerase/dehydratase family protein [Anaerolineae bacterium]